MLCCGFCFAEKEALGIFCFFVLRKGGEEVVLNFE